MSQQDFRPFVPQAGQSRIAGDTARTHAEATVKIDVIRGLLDHWKKLFAAPFRGLTTDAVCIPDLYTLRPEQAPTREIISAVMKLQAQLTDEQNKTMCFDAASSQWRQWQNTEIYVEDFGLRLDQVGETVRDGVMAVLRASMSAAGYEKIRNVMRLNRFLGDLVGGPAVLGEWSYLFCLYGTPSESAPWGWQIFGHHLCLNCVMIGGQMVITPTFLGAEPNFADCGPLKGLRLFADQERAGLDLMRSLSGAQTKKAVVANSMVGGDLPEGRRQFADGLHLGGAFQDNRIVPYEGLRGADMSRRQCRDLLDLVVNYLELLPPGPLAARMGDIERHMSATHFCWIGNRQEVRPFYYRIQSPVVFIEFDHHPGVYLTNQEPANFHVHTLVRTPNGNDYGFDLIRRHYLQDPHHNHRPE